jgi:aminodeoxyfutalosine synthase
LGSTLEATVDRVRRVRERIGATTRLSGFSLARLRDAEWSTLAGTLSALREAGLQLVAEAPVDLVDPSDVAQVFDAGLGLGALSVQEPYKGGRVALVLRVRAFVTPSSARTAVAPLARVQSASTPTTGYNDVRLVALARLGLPEVSVVQVDWPQYGPKLAQVALTFGANHLDRVSCTDDPALGWRRASVEDVRRHIVAAGLRPVESGAAS